MRSSDVNVEATQHPVSCPGSGSDFINLNRSVERSSAWLTHPGSQRGENSAFGKVASSLSYLIKDLFIFRAEEISECPLGHTRSLFQVAGALIGIQGTPGPSRNREQTRLWLVNADGFLIGARVERLTLSVWLRKCVSL